jgi:tuberculosinol/isotuberculosinol synthase
MISLKEFLSLPNEEVARLVRAAGPQVCVFPINGTRRWFALEHAAEAAGDPVHAYIDFTGRQHIDLYRLCFDHGLDTLLTPVFGSELLTRGDEYMRKIGAEGLARLATHSDFLSFYQNYNVRVHFYGDYRKQLADTSFSYLSGLFDHISKHTARNTRYRLFYGVFANDATETLAELSVRQFQNTGKIPSRTELVEMYYGEYVDPATLFIGFDKFSVFDYPMLGLGEENLYFTVAPSLYLTETGLRSILYDSLYLRPVKEPDYYTMSPSDKAYMEEFYKANAGRIFGVGKIHNSMWYPSLNNHKT